MTFINLDAAGFSGHPVAAGKVPGAKSLDIRGHCEGVQTTNAPMLVWDLKTNFAFPAAPQALEVVSSSVNDSAAGTGARTVLVVTLDKDFNEIKNTVALNGTTPVAVPGGAVHFRANDFSVLTAGSGLVNLGNLTLRVAGGGAAQDYIGAGYGVNHTLKYTVPAGRRLVIDSFYINTNGSGAAKTMTSDFLVKLVSGVEQVVQRNYFLTDTAYPQIALATGIGLDAGMSFFNKISAVSSNGVNYAISVSGMLVTV